MESEYRGRLLDYLRLIAREGEFERLKNLPRNQIISALLQDPRTTYREVAGIFDITYGGVGWLASKLGLNRNRRDAVFAADFVANHYPQLVETTMRRAARSTEYWYCTTTRSGHYLNRSKVLQGLGLFWLTSTCSERLQQAWRTLVDSGVVREELLVGVVLDYGLGQNPERFIAENLRMGLTVTEVTKLINSMARSQDVLTIGGETGGSTLQYYMRKKEIPTHGRGSPNPWWLWQS